MGGHVTTYIYTSIYIFFGFLWSVGWYHSVNGWGEWWVNEEYEYEYIWSTSLYSFLENRISEAGGEVGGAGTVMSTWTGAVYRLTFSSSVSWCWLLCALTQEYIAAFFFFVVGVPYMYLFLSVYHLLLSLLGWDIKYKVRYPSFPWLEWV